MLSMSTSYYVGVENGQMTLHVMAIWDNGEKIWRKLSEKTPSNNEMTVVKRFDISFSYRIVIKN